MPGSVAWLRPVNVRALRPEEQAFEDMLAGWAGQQSSRLLASRTIRARAGGVRRFAEFCGSMPWEWTPLDLEEWTSHLLSGPRPKAHSTIRNYQNAVALFCSYLTDARYGWAEQCLAMFDTHPVQIVHEWNTAIHATDHEARPGVRPLTRAELQQLFDYADDQVVAARKSKRKGWLARFRDATLFKVIYAYGLRRREAAMLEVCDFTRNASAPEFGRFGVCNVRYGKAVRGSQPRRRSVLSVFAWTAAVLIEYVEDVLPMFGLADNTTSASAGTGNGGGGMVLWPTERRARIRPEYIDERFAEYRDALGLDRLLHPHCLRHSYITHLIEDGFDPLFVQQQVGHAWASTTALYTGVSSDYRNKVLRRSLDEAFTPVQEGSLHE
ncbi:hypothetical protein GCM10027569_09280 [Flindersiella endophytica]